MSGGRPAQRRGRWGEAVVAEYLRARGWQIAALNFCTRFGELDIVAHNETYLIFVEVKLRRNENFAAARESVTKSKQRKLRIAAELYLQGHPTPLQPRFDVAEVYAPQGTDTRAPEITYLENAF